LAKSTGFRKNNEHKTPPAAGGFAFVRAFSALLLAALLMLAIVAGAEAPSGRALAQGSPGAQPTDQDTMVKDVVTLDSEIKSLDGRLGQLGQKSAALKERISGINGEIASRRQRVVSKRRALNDRVRDIYVNGRSNKLVLLMSSENMSDFFQRTDYLNDINRRDAELVNSIRLEAAGLSATLAELKKSKKEVDGVATDLKSRKQRLQGALAERQKVLARAGEQAAAVQEQSGRVEQKIKELNPPVTGRHTGRFLNMVATGYSPQEPGLSDHTATGMKAQHGVVAVDPTVIPLGTRLYVEGYGNAIAGDTGGAIKGNRIDLCFDTLAECNAYGKRNVRVEILE
jgi:peptidoglycan DL-endopeptidase CwlO